MSGQKLYVGIDPDLNGAVATVTFADGGRVVGCRIYPMPTLRSGPKGRREVNVRDLCTIINGVYYLGEGVVIGACVEPVSYTHLTLPTN